MITTHKKLNLGIYKASIKLRLKRLIMMNIKPIRTEQDYKAILKETESLMMAEFGTPEGDRLDVLVTLIEAWEHEHYPMDFPDLVEAIKLVMEQRKLQAKDLVPMIGQANRIMKS